MNKIVELSHRRKSLRFHVSNENDVVSKRHLGGAFFAQDQLELHRTLIPFNACVLDIGANVGNHTIYYGLFSRAAKVIPFEPNPVARERMASNIDLNLQHHPHLAEKVDLSYSHLGLGAISGGASITSNPSNNLGAVRLAAGAGDLELARLDDLPLPAIHFLKIDVEGMELEVLAGAKERIQADRPTIAIEVEEAKRRAFWDWVEASGYHVIAAQQEHPPMDYVCIPKF